MKNIKGVCVKYKKLFCSSPIVKIGYVFKKPSIAVCVLFYNKIDQTLECLQSFLYSQVPIYVLDNCSSEQQRRVLDEFANKHSQITIFGSSENLGVARGRNYLIKKTNEQWLFFVDNDITIAGKRWLTSFSQVLSNNKSVDIFIPKLFNKHENSYVSHAKMCVKDSTAELIKRDGDVTNMFPGGAAIISRKYFDRIGTYDDEMFVGFEDFELAVRAIVSNEKTLAIVIDSIELIHDHRYSDNEADKNAASIRYDENQIAMSEKRINELHGIFIRGNWRKWVKEQNEKIVVNNEK